MVYLPKLDIINPEELEIESKKEKSTLSQFDINIISNYEKRNKDQIKLLSVYKDIDKIDLRKIELMCDKYGLDYKVIKELLELYFNDHKIVNIINAFVEKYSNYIPYFKNNGNINFIYTSSYANVALSNIDNREDYLKTVTDPFSIVKGNKIAETNPNRGATGVTINSKKEYVLKENANRFSYEGKIVNYNLLKKPERKTSAFSFADFKKMQLENKNNK